MPPFAKSDSPSTFPFQRRWARSAAARGAARVFESVPLAWMLALGMTGALLVGCAAPRPPDSNLVEDVDVRGCSADSFREAGPLDVAIVIDTSLSTREPAERPPTARARRDRSEVPGRVVPVSFSVPDRRSTDRRALPGAVGSRLAMEVRAVRRLIEQGLLYDIRFAIVSYSGPGIPWPDAGSKRVGLIRSARLRMPLTRDARQLQSALDGILERGSEGSTVFYAGMRRANRLLESVTDPSRRRLALFISDSPRSVSPGMTGEIRHVDPRLKIAAITARDRKIVFHTFGLSPESGAWRRKTLGRIAGATGGAYHPVEDPDLLYCHLVQALQRPGTNPLRRGVFAGTESEVRKDGPGRRPDDSSGFDAQGSTGPAEGDLLALETDS